MRRWPAGTKHFLYINILVHVGCVFFFLIVFYDIDTLWKNALEFPCVRMLEMLWKCSKCHCYSIRFWQHPKYGGGGLQFQCKMIIIAQIVHIEWVRLCEKQVENVNWISGEFLKLLKPNAIPTKPTSIDGKFTLRIRFDSHKQTKNTSNKLSHQIVWTKCKQMKSHWTPKRTNTESKCCRADRLIANVMTFAKNIVYLVDVWLLVKWFRSYHSCGFFLSRRIVVTPFAIPSCTHTYWSVGFFFFFLNERKKHNASASQQRTTFCVTSIHFQSKSISKHFCDIVWHAMAL